MLATLGAAGVHVTTFTWEPDGVWSTERELTRGGAMGRAAVRFHLSHSGNSKAIVPVPTSSPAPVPNPLLSSGRLCGLNGVGRGAAG